MKLNGIQTHVDQAAGVQEEVAISFEANAVAFYAQISGLAKDKIGYPIRELSTNAWDASRGNMEVHLPTNLNPVFRVRDYGPGMSAEDMKNVYARLYASTKRGTNESVGGWGLGSKSPFAYLIGAEGAGSYNVTSYHGGMLRTYVLSLAAGGNPVMRLLAEMPSDEPTGMDVSFPVRRQDIRTFHDRASAILWSFNPRPKITPALGWKEPVVKASGEGWISYKDSSVPFYQPQVRMGCVMYPFDLNQIKTSGFLTDNDTVLFDAPIGSLKVTLSREELAYDDTTKTTLQNLVATYEASFISQLQQKVDDCDSLFEACRVFSEETDGLGETRASRLRQMVKWAGMYLSLTIVKDRFKTSMLGDGWQRFDKFDDTHVRSSWAEDAKVVIEHNPSYSLGRFEMAGLIGQKILWVRCKRVDRDNTLRMLGNPEVVDLDQYKVPLAKRTSKTIRKRKTLVVTERGAHRITQDIDMADGGFYLEMMSPYGGRRRGREYYRLNPTGSGIEQYETDNIFKGLIELGLLEVGQIILLKQQDQELSDDWAPLGEDFIPALKAKVDVVQLSGLHAKTVNNLDTGMRHFAEVPLRFAPIDVVELQREVSRLVVTLKGQSSSSTESDKAYALLQKLGVEVQIPDRTCPIAALETKWAALCFKYPLLKMILKNVGYYGIRSEDRIQLNHYMELLTRPAQDAVPEAAPVPVAEDEEEDEILIEDDEDEDGDIVDFEEAA
jgi:hypothetical protein